MFRLLAYCGPGCAWRLALFYSTFSCMALHICSRPQAVLIFSCGQGRWGGSELHRPGETKAGEVAVAGIYIFLVPAHNSARPGYLHNL